jgi:hypothetical protein
VADLVWGLCFLLPVHRCHQSIVLGCAGTALALCLGARQQTSKIRTWNVPELAGETIPRYFKSGSSCSSSTFGWSSLFCSFVFFFLSSEPSCPPMVLATNRRNTPEDVAICLTLRSGDAPPPPPPTNANGRKTQKTHDASNGGCDIPADLSFMGRSALSPSSAVKTLACTISPTFETDL